MNIVAGVIGAVAGFVAGTLLFALSGFDNRADPIASGLIALLVFGPAGAVGGAFLFTWMVMHFRGQTPAGASSAAVRDHAAATDDAAASGPETAAAVPPAIANASSSVAKTSLKAIGLVVALVAVIGGLYAWYAIATATPWLNPNAPNVVLQFELRLPSGAPLPAPRDIKIELQTDINSMPGELRGDGVRRDGERVVIAGQVDLAFRTRFRQIEIKIKDQPDRLHDISLSAKAPHTSELGPWQRHVDGSEIRYRAKWPGQE